MKRSGDREVATPRPDYHVSVDVPHEGDDGDPPDSSSSGDDDDEERIFVPETPEQVMI